MVVMGGEGFDVDAFDGFTNWPVWESKDLKIVVV